MSATYEYLTARLSEAAFLIARGFPLLRIEPTRDPRMKEFVFPAEAATVGAAFYEERGANVNAREFARALTDLKATLYPRVLRQARA